MAVSSLTLVALRGQLANLRTRGFEPIVVASPEPLLERWALAEGVRLHPLEIARDPSIGDIGVLRRLTRLIEDLSPDIVHAHTPKGGLLGMVAARRAGVGSRIYHAHGVPDRSVSLARREAWAAAHRLTCAMATRVVAVGPFVERSLLRAGVSRSKLVVLANGSANGVDPMLFDPDALEGDRLLVRRELGIPAGALVFGFVGRLVREKGIAAMLEAFALVRRRWPDARLLVVGPEDRGSAFGRALAEADGVVWSGWRDDTPRLYAAMDVFVLPSQREGLPTVVLEAAAMRLPTVVSNAPGCLDAVVPGETALIAGPTASSLADALIRLADDGALRARLGSAAREHVLRTFAQEALWEATEELYRDDLARTQRA